MSHSEVPEFSYPKDFPKWWDWWVKLQTDNFELYFRTIIRQCTKEGKNPIYIVRYEDLLSN